MASFIEEKRGGSAGERLEGTKIILTESYNYLIYSDDRFASRQQILYETPGLPLVGLVYEENGLRCISRDAKRDEVNPHYWQATAEFNNGVESQKKDPANPSPDPTTWFPVFSIDSFETREKVLNKDLTPDTETLPGRSGPGPYWGLNSAYDPFETPLTGTYTLCSFSGSQFEDGSLTLEEILDRNDTVNDDEFFGKPKYTLKMNVTSAVLGLYVGVLCWRIGYKFTYDRTAWTDKRLDVGPNHIVSGQKLACFDCTNTFKIVGSLDGNGGLVDPCSIAEPATLEFLTLTPLDFSSFIRTES